MHFNRKTSKTLYILWCILRAFDAASFWNIVIYFPIPYSLYISHLKGSSSAEVGQVLIFSCHNCQGTRASNDLEAQKIPDVVLIWSEWSDELSIYWVQYDYTNSGRILHKKLTIYKYLWNKGYSYSCKFSIKNSHKTWTTHALLARVCLYVEA